jgi:hypothetical protein
MTPLRVDCQQTSSGWSCSVTVGDDAGATRHAVMVARDVLAELAPADLEPTRLVRASFEFLLERESRGSILRSFELPVIGRYFPEWEAEITRRLASG